MTRIKDRPKRPANVIREDQRNGMSLSVKQVGEWFTWDIFYGGKMIRSSLAGDSFVRVTRFYTPDDAWGDGRDVRDALKVRLERALEER